MLQLNIHQSNFKDTLNVSLEENFAISWLNWKPNSIASVFSFIFPVMHFFVEYNQLCCLETYKLIHFVWRNSTWLCVFINNCLEKLYTSNEIESPKRWRTLGLRSESSKQLKASTVHFSIIFHLLTYNLYWRITVSYIHFSYHIYFKDKYLHFTV